MTLQLTSSNVIHSILPLIVCAHLCSGCNTNDNVEPARNVDNTRDSTRSTCDKRDDDNSQDTCGRRDDEVTSSTSVPCSHRTDGMPAAQCADIRSSPAGKTAHGTHQHAATISQEDCKEGCGISCNTNAPKNLKKRPKNRSRIFLEMPYCMPCKQSDE